ncbi:MAG: hypothetical protein ACTSUE_26490, partial [Promethearchaeota archaeon]
MNGNSSPSSEKDFPPLKDGILPLSVGGDTGQTYISTLPPELLMEEDKDETGNLRNRKHNESKSTTESSSFTVLRKRKGRSSQKKRSIRQVIRDWNASFERGVVRVEVWVDFVIHYLFRVVEWFLLTIQRVGTIGIGKFSTKKGMSFGARMHYLTRPVSMEERGGGGSARSKDYIWILYELRRKCMISTKRRLYLYKTVVVCLIFVTFLCMGLFYAADSAEYNTHIRYMHVDTQTGREIMNLMYPPEFPRFGFNEDVEWMLYILKKEAARKDTVSFQRLVPPTLLSDYVEIDTRRFGRVNISISEMVQRMKDDSNEAGKRMIQPCLCPAQYGVPLNIVLVRYSLEHDT